MGSPNSTWSGSAVPSRCRAEDGLVREAGPLFPGVCRPPGGVWTPSAGCSPAPPPPSEVRQWAIDRPRHAADTENASVSPPTRQHRTIPSLRRHGNTERFRVSADTATQNDSVSPPTRPHRTIPCLRRHGNTERFRVSADTATQNDSRGSHGSRAVLGFQRAAAGTRGSLNGSLGVKQ